MRYSWVEIILFGIVGLGLAAVAAIILGMLFVLVDDPGKGTELSGVVQSISYHPAYSSTTLVQTGKVMVPITNHYPESWTVAVDLGTQVVECSVRSNPRDWTPVDSKVLVTVRQGRLSGWTYADSPRPYRKE